MRRTQANQRGFTITELLIVIVATGVLSGAIFTFMFNYWRASYVQQSNLDTLSSRLNAGDILRSLFSTSSGMMIQHSIEDEYPLNISGGGSSYWPIIHATPGEIEAADNEVVPVAYFKRFSFDADRNIIFADDTPYEDEYILYIDGASRTLYLRSLANPFAAGNVLTTSCPPAVATASCPADRVIAENIQSVDMRYFSRTGNEIDYTSVQDPDTGEYIGPDFQAVEVAEFKLNITESPPFQQGDTTQVSTIIRVALRN